MISRGNPVSYTTEWGRSLLHLSEAAENAVEEERSADDKSSDKISDPQMENTSDRNKNLGLIPAIRSLSSRSRIWYQSNDFLSHINSMSLTSYPSRWGSQLGAGSPTPVGAVGVGGGAIGNSFRHLNSPSSPTPLRGTTTREGGGGALRGLLIEGSPSSPSWGGLGSSEASVGVWAADSTS